MHIRNQSHHRLPHSDASTEYRNHLFDLKLASLTLRYASTVPRRLPASDRACGISYYRPNRGVLSRMVSAGDEPVPPSDRWVIECLHSNCAVLLWRNEHAALFKNKPILSIRQILACQMLFIKPVFFSLCPQRDVSGVSGKTLRNLSQEATYL